MNLSFFIARRYLAKQKGTFSSFIIRLAICATALSVAVMIVAVSIITGFQHNIREKLFSFWGQVHVVPHDANPSNIISAQPIQYNDTLVRNIRSMQGVLQVAPFAVRPGILQAHGQMEGIRLKGITKDYKFPKGIQFSGNMIDYTDTAYAHQIIVAKAMADKLNVKAGEDVMLCFLEPGATAPRVRKLKVVALFHTGMDEVDQYFGVCDLRLLQRMNNWTPDEINGYQVDLAASRDAVKTSLEIYEKYITPPLYTESIYEIYQNIFDWLNMQNVTKGILLTMMAIIAVINLAATLLILIVDRARMVALLKALGMNYSSISGIFIALSGLIGVLGILLGTALSLLLVWLQQHYGFLKLPEATYYMSTVPVKTVWWHIALIDVCSLAVCLVCMLLPALYIRLIQPAKWLQFK